MMRSLLFIPFCILLLSFSFSGHCQSQEKIYSTLILNFARGIQWPENFAQSAFSIGVLEYPPLASELSSAAATMKIGSKKIQVVELHNTEGIRNLDIIFIPAYKAKLLADVLARIGSGPTLVITNKMDLAKKGSGVNFLLVNGKLKYEINCKSIEERGMKIPSNIKGMGIVVN